MRGGMIRAVQSTRRDRLRWRKFKTAIKRQDTIRGLEELIEGKCTTLYAERLRGYIERMSAEEKARSFIKEKYGYIATRGDLQREPHGWRVPQAVKVSVVVQEE